MNTIVHIGQHKTGTTSTQQYLRSRKAELEKKGLYVPDVLVGYDSPSHWVLNVYALNQTRLSSMKERLLVEREASFFRDLAVNLRADILRHYQRARSLGCKDVIWSNEGLYLLNSPEEYGRLVGLFRPHSGQVICVCCFREVESYRASFIRQLERQGISPSGDPDSYRYLNHDSWLFDYDRKKALLEAAFDKAICFDYQKDGNVSAFMDRIGYPAPDGDFIRHNVTQRGSV